MFISTGYYPRHSLGGQLQKPAALPSVLFEYWAARAQEPVLGLREMIVFCSCSE
jgi:hypothetical protein